MHMPAARDAELVLQSYTSETGLITLMTGIVPLAFYIYLSIIKVLPHKDDWWISPDGDKTQNYKSKVPDCQETFFTCFRY